MILRSCWSAVPVKEALIKLITFMVRQAHHERNQYITVRPEPVEGLNQRFLNDTQGSKNLFSEWTSF
ncbi:hypothetical protein [Nitrosomonas sp.]|uniref:hypothetical protein n=1 Tax=Nitrosomonas sp. TaxID=42353 RepID=UPI0025D0F42C|nr:hypothetical protein [Nitrosomonas sp.]MBY0483416.1 hypothetical protein [Nitrosomonas sp.]